MPAIWSEEWYEAMLEMADSRDDLSAKVPQGEWNVAVEVEGDGQSPYIPADVVKHFFVRIVDGKIVEYKEFPEKIPGAIRRSIRIVTSAPSREPSPVENFPRSMRIQKSGPPST